MVRLDESETSKLTESLLKVQSSIAAVKKSADNKFFHSKYAKLEDVLAVAKEALSKENLLLLQPTGQDDRGLYVSSEIRNSSGEAVASRIYLLGVTDMQKLGAAITYGRRFSLASLLAMEQEDDDGETAVGRGELMKKISRLEPGKAKIATEHLNKLKNEDLEGLTKLNNRLDSLLEGK